MANLTVRIVTPHAETIIDEVQQCTAPGLEGEFGVLPGHLPYLMALKIGGMCLDTAADKKHYAVGEGLGEVVEDRITFFVESAEEAAVIDVDRAEKARDKAEDDLKGVEDVTQPEFKVYDSALRRAVNRIEVAKQA